MLELRGKYNTAKVFTDNVEETAVGQIIELCNQEFVEGSQIRIMPDTHAGAGCTIGTTMTLHGKVVPNLVGVDIGCGMTMTYLDREIDLVALDQVIREHVPSGFNIREKLHMFAKMADLDALFCKKEVNLDRARLSVGTLGGGNHFIEVNEDDTGAKYLVVHSGSRNLGKQVAEYYQKLAVERCEGVPKHLAYLDRLNYTAYIHDMEIVQRYADTNRSAIINTIVVESGLKRQIPVDMKTIHNYIDVGRGILRKGAVSAQKGEMLLIPINMRDGSLLCVGKGNPDWNYSAPHGAGRIMSRSQAKKDLKLEDYEDSMKGIYTTSIGYSTIDEAPMAYKPMQEIIDNIQDTVEILKVIKPIYNFKAGEGK